MIGPARPAGPGLFRNLLLLLGVFLLPLAFWPPFEDAFKLPQFCAAAVIAVAAAARLPAGFKSWQAPALFLAAGHAFSCAAGPSGRAGDWLLFSALLGGGVLLGPALARSGRLSRVLDIAIAAGALAALYGAVQFAGMDFAGQGKGMVRRPFSTMGNPDFLAAYLAAVLPLALIRAARSADLFRTGQALLIAGGIMLAQSRGAWLGTLGAGVLGILLVWRSQGRFALSRGGMAVLAFAGLFAAAFLFFSEDAHQRAARMFNLRHFDASGRIFMWEASLRMIRDRPLAGEGLGGYGAAYPARHAELLRHNPDFPYFFTDNAHNDYLQLSAEEGLPVMGIWIWVWCVFVRMAWARLRSGSWTALGLLVGFAALGINAFFNFPWYILPAQGWFWIAFAWLGSAGIKPGAGGREILPWGGGLARLGAATVALAAGLGGWILSARALEANARLKLSGDFLAAGRWPEALMLARSSAQRWTFWEGKERPFANASLAAYRAGDLDAAEAFALESLKLRPDSPSVLNQLGLAYARRGRLEEAEAALVRALTLNPHQAESLHALGNIRYLRQDPLGAAMFWRRALDENPELAGARGSLEALEAELSRKQ